MPILGSKIPNTGNIKTIMSNNKIKIGSEKVISFQEISREKNLRAPSFSEGLYHWVMFVISLYSRVRESLKIDFESFVILQVVVSHSLYQINKSGSKTFTELETHITSITEKKSIKNSKLTFASIAEVLALPRETVRRKVLQLSKQDILTSSSKNGIKLGTGYKTIYKEFVTKTTSDLSSLVKKWKKGGTLENLLELE
tara:strand:+ start:174 stop:767 length:594 start_codon:yes stop_codon:yes gene_type:complete